MFKLVVLSVLLAVAMSAPAPSPSGIVAPIAYHAAPSLAVVHHAPAFYHAPVVAAVPTAISSQSTTVVHGAKAALVAAPIAYAHHGYLAAPLVHAW